MSDMSDNFPCMLSVDINKNKIKKKNKSNYNRDS